MGITVIRDVDDCVTINDSIAATILLQNADSEVIARSPNGISAAFVTKKGNIDANLNEYQLLILDVQSFRTDGSDLEIQGREILTVTSDANVPALRCVKWIDDTSLALIVTGRVCEIDTVSKKIKYLTRADHEAVGFQIDHRHGVVAYAIVADDDLSDAYRSGYVVETNILHTVTYPGGRRNPYQFYEYYVQKAGATDPLRLWRSAVRLWAAPPAWLVDSGRHLVLSVFDPDYDPAWWVDYEPARALPVADAYRAAGSLLFLGHPTWTMNRFLRLDTETSEGKYIIEAPNGSGLNSYGLHAADSYRPGWLLVANTYLPRDFVSGAESPGGGQSARVVEYNLSSGEIVLLADLDAALSGHPGCRLRSLEIDRATGGLLLNLRDPDGGDLTVAQALGWRSHSVDQGDGMGPQADWALSVQQQLNVPPEIVADFKGAGGLRLSTRLNRGLAERAFGEMKTISWVDDLSQAWKAGLILPDMFGYSPPFPLLIQTHGYNENEFWIDGPGGSTSGYPGRSLIGRGVAVLQIGRGAGARNTPDEIRFEVEGYISAVQHLEASGLIDPARVGIHAWSRTGYYLTPALADGRVKFASASATDADLLTLRHYTDFFGLPMAMLDMEGLYGGQPWTAEGFERCAESDALGLLEHVSTPLRIETTGWVPAWWDVYALLRRNRKPVEYLSFPGGDHTLIKPAERLISQQGCSDWHEYWLTDTERKNSHDANQYQRWRCLRDRAEADGAKEPGSVGVIS